MKGRVTPAAVPGLAARRRCRLRRRRDRADRAACVSGMLSASFCPAWDGSEQSSTKGSLYAFCLPQSPSPRPQHPGGTIDTPAKLLDPPSPPSGEPLGKVDLAGVLRAPEPGRSGAAAPTIPRARTCLLPRPHLRAREQRCFVPAATTSLLRLRDWGRVGPQPRAEVWGGKGQAPTPR